MSGWSARLAEPRTAMRLAAFVGVLLVAAAFGLVVLRSVALDFHNRQPFWVADAIPAAISELYYGHQKRYTALESVHRRFHARVDREVATARTIDAAIRRLIETANENPGTAYVLLGPDDKGIVDLIEGGFVLYGPRTESIIAFYFTLLALSCLVYLLAFWRSPSALFLLVAFLGMFYLVMPMFLYNGQLRSLLALRVLPILSIVACLHCLVFMAHSAASRVRWWHVVLLGLQLLLVTFTINLRSTTLWQVATILGLGVVVAGVVLAQTWFGSRRRLSPARDVTGRWTLRAGADDETGANDPVVGNDQSGANDCRSAGDDRVAGERVGAIGHAAANEDAGAINRAPTGTSSSVGARFIAPTSATPTSTPSAPAAPRFQERPSSMAPLLAAGLTIGLTVAGYLGLQAYHAAVMPEEYRRGDEIATRVVWHNVFTGFAYHPVLRERFEVWLDDVSIIAATGRYLVETNQEARWQAMGGRMPVPGPADGAAAFEGIKFAAYDPAVREMLVARCTTYVRECLETFLWTKPISLANNLAWIYGFRALPPDLDVAESPYFGDILMRQFLGTSQGMDNSGQRAYLWTPAALAIVVPFIALLLVESRETWWASLWAAIALALGSTIPTVAGYAAPHTIGEAAIAWGMLVYLGIVLSLAAGLRRLLAPAPLPSRTGRRKGE